jgi:uncharacterized protein
MLVKIEEIQEPGLKRTEAIAPAVLDEALKESGGFSLVTATPLSASFKKVSGRIFVKGSFTAQLECPCKRCTTDVPVPISVDFSLRMVQEQAPAREGDEGEAPPSRRRKAQQKKDDDGQAQVAASFELDEIDAEPFDGKTIDLDPVVREQVLLALPVSVVCKEDCKGLCPVCGQDLNVQDCGHGKVKEVDVRLAKLKDIKLKN